MPAELEMPSLDAAEPEVEQPTDQGENELEAIGEDVAGADEGLADEGDQLDGDESSEEDEGDENAADPSSADGRRMPDSIKKALAAVKATNPEAAKELRGLYFANQEYRNAFPTVADAATAKSLIEEIGGPEGVQEIAAEREEWGEIDRQYSEGDPNFIKRIAESNPDSFVKIAPHAINEWAQRAPEQYAFFAQSLTVNMLKNAGIPDELSRAYEAASGNQQVQAQIAKAYNAIVDMHERAQQFSQKRPDPREAQLTQREQQFEQQRRASFEEGIASQAENYLGDKMKPEIDRILGSRKIDDEARETIRNLVTLEVQKRLGEIPGFEQKLEAFYRTGDAQKSIAWIKAQYDRILPEATKKVVAPLYRNIKPSAPAKPGTATAKSGAPAVRGEVTLREMPEWKDIDFNKCTTADVASGWAILKSGKKASGWM